MTTYKQVICLGGPLDGQIINIDDDIPVNYDMTMITIFDDFATLRVYTYKDINYLDMLRDIISAYHAEKTSQ